jgi:hypothetical protein
MHNQIDFAVGAPGEGAAVRVGDARILASHVNPRVPVRLDAQDGSVEIRFGRAPHSESLVRLDLESLEPTSSATVPGQSASGASTHVARVIVDDGGGFVECSTRGSIYSGHQAVVQAFHANGSVRGAPVVISPSDADVIGPPLAVTTDGRHIVATFTAARAGSFELIAVPIVSL